ncbi:hypothetical protein COY16_03170 [Candidatus Roizmanbacteria bacterium CG_4_10_14_0_2_um_filter_39_13]|uniref:Glycosyltransferase RgtA/B/C/D-like domain-containing protein n=1 Tax=Candidatus Roizmanbacteria bacterium CG_4_10_14_0_2_um_filter_39_13 TaxID=1974825 RepID=A0A2M7TYK9_9BACT|nr:MAG: hypothetical protein COY16_03170 [Candidatus Roizmanbacteria bacterium CG_4_10_14_0_2_um_filter_39_13]
MLLKKLQWAYLNIFKTRLLLFLFLLVYFATTFLSYKDFGLTMDEFFVYTRGEYFYHKVVGNDKYLQKGFVIKEYGNENLLYYNSTYSALLYALNDSQSYENYHLYNMIFASLSFVVMYEFVLFCFKNDKIALLGPVFLFLTPRFLGHIPANPKDIPFATVFMVALFLIYIHRKLPNNLKILLLGAAIGLATSLRLIGLSLIFVYFFYTLYIQGFDLFKNSLKKSGEFIFEMILISMLSFMVLMASIPYIGADPVNHTLELLQVNKIFPWYGTILFFGSVFNESTIPLSYLPIWLLISTPIFILILSIMSFMHKRDQKQRLLHMLILISIGIQILMYVLLKPVIYNGVRHYLFLLPQLVILSVIGLQLILKKYPKFKLIIVSAVLINTSLILFFYVKNYPYLYPYFNDGVQMVPGLEQQFDQEYWAASDKEALIWLKDTLTEKSDAPKIYMCSKSMSLNYYFPDAIDMNHDISQADYIICYNQPELKEIKKSIDGDVIFSVERMGRVYNTIYKPTR